MSDPAPLLNGQPRAAMRKPCTYLGVNLQLRFDGQNVSPGAAAQAVARAVLRAGASGKAEFTALEQLRHVTVHGDNGITYSCPEE